MPPNMKKLRNLQKTMDEGSTNQRLAESAEVLSQTMNDLVDSATPANLPVNILFDQVFTEEGTGAGIAECLETNGGRCNVSRTGYSKEKATV